MRRTKKNIKFKNKKTKSYKRLLHSARPSLLAKAGMISDRSSIPMGRPVDFDYGYDRNSVPMGVPYGFDTGQTSSPVPEGVPVGLYPILLPSRSASSNSEYHDALDPVEYYVERILSGVDLREAIREYEDYIYTEVMNAKTAKERADIVRTASKVPDSLYAKFRKLDKEYDREFPYWPESSLWALNEPRRVLTSNDRARKHMLQIERAKVFKAVRATEEIELWAKENTGITARASRSLNKGLTRAARKIMSVVR